MTGMQKGGCAWRTARSLAHALAPQGTMRPTAPLYGMLQPIAPPLLHYRRRCNRKAGACGLRRAPLEQRPPL
jgi:hypothetical protein